MAEIDELFDSLPIDDIASQLGASRKDTEEGIAAALPALLEGLKANTEDEAGEKSLLDALGSKTSDLIDGGISLGDIDLEDGGKIVKNIFGEATGDVAARLGGTNSGGAGFMSGLLPILAPLVMAFLAKKMGGNKGGGLGDLIGGMLGGGGGLTDILGGVLGGGSSSGGLGGLGDLLGGLLGGGPR